LYLIWVFWEWNLLFVWSCVGVFFLIGNWNGLFVWLAIRSWSSLFVWVRTFFLFSLKWLFISWYPVRISYTCILVNYSY
jgi:hypothetical protein